MQSAGSILAALFMALGRLNHHAHFVGEDLFVDLPGQLVGAADVDDQGIGRGYL